MIHPLCEPSYYDSVRPSGVAGECGCACSSSEANRRGRCVLEGNDHFCISCKEWRGGRQQYWSAGRKVERDDEYEVWDEGCEYDEYGYSYEKSYKHRWDPWSPRPGSHWSLPNPPAPPPKPAITELTHITPRRVLWRKEEA